MHFLCACWGVGGLYGQLRPQRRCMALLQRPCSMRTQNKIPNSASRAPKTALVGTAVFCYSCCAARAEPPQPPPPPPPAPLVSGPAPSCAGQNARQKIIFRFRPIWPISSVRPSEPPAAYTCRAEFPKRQMAGSNGAPYPHNSALEPADAGVDDGAQWTGVGLGVGVTHRR